MNKEEILQEFKGNFLALRKILNKWDLIPGAPNDEFDSLNHQLLSHLYKGADCDKISRILSSELIATYGLTIGDQSIQEISKEIIDWWSSN